MNLDQAEKKDSTMTAFEIIQHIQAMLIEYLSLFTHPVLYKYMRARVLYDT